ncbi:MAG: hypothetical protein A2W03_13080 [Candidatus Aminicenantes bacterium RBG_16_63_16]|nr:MAG: hypothetical protein A2W03_13080 [Candidatus Aminicenantes bacterium RBG_16_63_16]
MRRQPPLLQTACAVLSLAIALAAPVLAAAAPRERGPAGASIVQSKPDGDPRTVRTIAAAPAAGPIVIDGVLSEPVWQTPGAGGFTQRDPFDGQPASEPTTVWVAFDRDHLYVAARLTDSEPGKIIGRLGRRDEFVESDWFDVGFDPYHDRRSGYYFGINPFGSIEDGTLSNDEEPDATWDGIWTSAARIDDQGWTVEIRIPFDQLRFKPRDVQVWGVNFQRVIKRKNEEDHFAWVPKEQSGLVSRFADLTGLTGIAAGRRLEISPFALSQANVHPEEPGNPFRTGSAFGANAGFDLKGGLSSNLTLNLSVNPDFGQVEVDPAVINITDQETYYQEKRPFFIEGAGIFSFGTGGPNVIRSVGWENPDFFYSRRIGRAPQGSAGAAGFADAPDWTTILSAAKVTGKIGRGFNLGVISALAEREYARVDIDGARSSAEIEPFSHYGVVRGLKEFGEGRSGLGFIATSVARDLDEGALEASLNRSALALGVDGWTFLDKDRGWALAGWAGMTEVRGSAEAMTSLQRSSLHYFQRPDAGWVEVDETATSLSGWAGRFYVNKQKGNVVFNAALGAMSPGFEGNDLGYHTRGDIFNGHVEAGYRRLQPGRVFRSWTVTSSYYRNYDFGGNRIGEYIYLDGKGQLLNYWTATLHLDYEPPKYSHYLTRGGPIAYYPSGETVRATLATDDRKPLIVRFSGYYRYHPSGGYNWSLGGGVTWKPSPNLSLSVGPSYTWRYSEGQWVRSVADPLKTSTYGVRYVLSDIIQKTLPIEMRVNWTFTPRLSLQAYIQPYLAAGDFFAFKELAAARTFDFDYYGEGDSTISYADGVYTADPDGPAGPAEPFTFADPDFNLKSLRGTVVLRWEYRPGSMLYLVWTQKRAGYAHPGDFELWRDLGDIFRAPGENIFMIKLSYRFEL